MTRYFTAESNKSTSREPTLKIQPITTKRLESELNRLETGDTTNRIGEGHPDKDMNSDTEK